MLQIIVATDFSEVADNAINYACKLASKAMAEVIVIHSYVISVTFQEMPLIVMPVDDALNTAECKLESIISNLKEEFSNLSIKGKVFYGDIIDSLEEFTDNESNLWMIVVGNSNTGENTNWLDSKMIQAFHRLKCPVLAVPPEACFNTIKKIGFSYDNKYEGSELALEQLKQISQLLDAELHLVHTETGGFLNQKEPEIENKTKQLLENIKPIYHFVTNTTIESFIETFVSEHQIDWLAVMPRQHSFLQSIFHKSHTKAIAHKTHIPLVALHEL